MRHVELACQILLAVVFGWSAVSKLASREAFRRFGRSIEPLTGGGTWPAAALCAAEALVLPLVVVAPPVGFGLAAGLVAVLTAGVAVVLRRGLAVRCRCFGGGEAALGTRHVVRNLALLGVAALGLAVAVLPGGAGVDGPGVLLAAGVALLAAALVIRFDDVADLFGQ
ncbi:MauE/DoxX family redox-associated membrane protein [Microbispora bryophytorum]|uniref:MauE/DoxX family redox-associated membrane protein n=1 Tax=Microbispora bryophytorum TaxID=1460882 RepID=UPI0033CAA629